MLLLYARGVAKQKSIIEMIHKPKPAATRCEVTDDEVDVAGTIDTLTVEAGEYRAFDIADALLSNLIALNTASYRASVIRTRFINANMTGIQLPGSHIKDVMFDGCRLNLSNIKQTTFERCLFVNCDLSESDFAGSELKNVLLESCKADISINFSNCKCERVEFSDTNLGTIKGFSGLRGATITEQNLIELAPLLANEFGLLIN